MSRAKRTQPKQKKSIASNISRLKIHSSISPAPMTQAEWEAAEDLLAKMIAKGVLTDHPKGFGKGETLKEEIRKEKEED